MSNYNSMLKDYCLYKDVAKKLGIQSSADDFFPLMFEKAQEIAIKHMKNELQSLKKMRDALHLCFQKRARLVC